MSKNNVMQTHHPLATCIGCGCTDLQACEGETGPCSWVRLDREAGLGVCSECPEQVEAWDLGDRELRVPNEGPGFL